MLTCVSCDNTFEPAPHGGFCPDCDTPHPDFGRPEAEDDADAEQDPDDGEADSADDGATEDADEAADVDEDEPAADDEDADDLDADAEETDEVAESEVDADEAEEAVDDEADHLDEADDESDLDDAGDLDDEADGAGADDESEVEDDESEVEDDESDDTEADGDDGTAECGSCGASVDADASFCPECGSELGDDENEPEELSACPDCGTDVDDESYCPSCGTDLDAVRDRLGESDGDAPREVTLVVDGDSYTFGDGDTFGRQENDWLESLVSASGGREEVKYISSEHLTFSVEDDGVYVTDTSTNGTSLNGEDLDGDRTELEDGDELELAGRATVRVEL